MLKKRAQPFQDIESIISAGVTIKGEIASQGSVRIDGQIEGNLDIKGDLIIGEKGVIQGEVRAENIILAGKVNGAINSQGRLGITSTGIMQGEVSCSILAIDEGGLLEGSSKMIRVEEEKNAVSH